MTEYPTDDASQADPVSETPASTRRHSDTNPFEISPDRLDPDALRVIYRLRHLKHEAYLVGGCVRDALLGRTPKDFDVATSAHPGEVRAAFGNCRLIGRRFRLAHVYFRSGKVIEVATFRANPVEALDDTGTESDLLITRDNVFGNAEEDARRRDFTVNGLFYDSFAEKVIDYVGGQDDLEAHRIATIGDPEIRMREDPVRTLRAVRFAARLGFTIHPDTFAAMRRHSAELARCAPARVLEEIFKILRCGAATRAFDLLRSCGALQQILPALCDAVERVGEDGRRRLQAHLAALDAVVAAGPLPSDAVLLGALLIHLAGLEAPLPPDRDLVAPGAVPARPGDDDDAAAPAPPAGTGPDPHHRAAAHREESPADQLLQELVRTARLPRRIAERTRLAMSAQGRMQHPAAGKRRRRKRGAASAQAYYADAIQLFEIAARATGQGLEEVERLKQQVESRPEPGRSSPGAHAHDAGTNHRRGGREAAPRDAGPHDTRASGGNEARGTEGPAAAAGEGKRRRRRRGRGGRRRGRRGPAQPGGEKST